MRTLLFLLLLLATRAQAQPSFPEMPPCGRAFLFERDWSTGTLLFDQVTVPDLAAPAGPFTLEAWVKYEGAAAWPDGFHTIAAFGEIERGDRPLLAVRYGVLELWSGSSRLRGGHVPLDAWTHVAYAWDGAVGRLYVDGVETASGSNAPLTGGANFYIGYSRGNTGWNGQIDEVMVWTEARTAGQIAADAHGRVDPTTPNLYAYFKLDAVVADAWTGDQQYAFNEVDDRRGVLGWTQGHFTGRPIASPVKPPGPANAVVLSCMLNTPLDAVLRSADFLEISDAGTGRNDGAVLGVAIYPGSDTEPSAWLAHLASAPGDDGKPVGTGGLGHDAQGRTLVLQSGDGSEAGYLLVVDHSRSDGDKVVRRHDVGAFVRGRGYAESDLYAVVRGPEDDLFVVDAAAGAIVRIEDETGYMSVFATFDGLPNPAPAGPPTIDAVPTGIAFDGARFFVTALTDFSSAVGNARLLTVEIDGRVGTFRDGLTTAIDVALDPRDGVPVVVEFGRAGADGVFLPGTGRILKLYEGRSDLLADGLTMPTALAHGTDGTLYVTTLGGQLLRYEAGSTVDREQPGVPGAFALSPNYPNPFNPATQVSFTLRQPLAARVTAFDALGRAVAVLVDEPLSAGTHTVTWDASGLPSGVYLIRLETTAGAQTQRAVLLK